MLTVSPTFHIEHPHFEIRAYKHESARAAHLSVKIESPTVLVSLGEIANIDLGRHGCFFLNHLHFLVVYAPAETLAIVLEAEKNYELIFLSAPLALIRAAAPHVQKNWRDIIDNKIFMFSEQQVITKEINVMLQQCLATPQGGTLHYLVIKLLRETLKLVAKNTRQPTKSARHVYDYLIAHAFDKEDAAVIVANAGLLNQTAREKFRELTNTSPLTFLMELRIEKAKQLLTDTDLEVKDIAAQVGFLHYLPFNTAFQRVVGKPALAYRKEMRSKI